MFVIESTALLTDDYYTRVLWSWTHWDLNPGPSACEADVIPLHHVPSAYKRNIKTSVGSKLVLFSKKRNE